MGWEQYYKERPLSLARHIKVATLAGCPKRRGYNGESILRPNLCQ